VRVPFQATKTALQARRVATPSNTRLPRRGLRPLATAGEVVGLELKAVDSPSPPLRSALGPSANAKR
jgi:hypothetical protein